MHYGRVMVSQLGNVRSGETVCVLADEGIETELMEALTRASEQAGAETHLMRVKSRFTESKTVIEVISKYSVVFALTSGQGIGLDSLRKATKKGARVVRFIHASVRTASECLRVDYEKMRKDAEALGTILTEGKEIHIGSVRGSELTFSVHGNPSLSWDTVSKGGMMYIPRGSVNVAPVEDFGDGSLVIDGTTWQFGRVSEPFKLVVKRGRVVRVMGSGREADWLRAVLRKPFQNANRLAEFVVGLNPKASFDRYMPEGEKVRGAVAMDIGYRSGIADTEVGKHTDMGSVRNVTMIVDGEKIIEKGKLSIQAAI